MEAVKMNSQPRSSCNTTTSLFKTLDPITVYHTRYMRPTCCVIYTWLLSSEANWSRRNWWLIRIRRRWRYRCNVALLFLAISSAKRWRRLQILLNFSPSLALRGKSVICALVNAIPTRMKSSYRLWLQRHFDDSNIRYEQRRPKKFSTIILSPATLRFNISCETLSTPLGGFFQRKNSARQL